MGRTVRALESVEVAHTESLLTNRVLVAESELQAVDLVQIEWVWVQDFDIHLPLLQIVTFHDRDSRRDMLLHLYGPTGQHGGRDRLTWWAK